MKVFDIYNIELDNQDCCYLVKDGIFWRAYEKSAMRFCLHIKPYQVTKKRFKIINATLVYIGFPNKNLEKFLEKCKELNLKTELNESLIKISGFEENNGFDDWKNKFEEIPSAVKEKKSVYGILNQAVNPKGEGFQSHSIRSGIETLVAELRQFPIASKTPMECQNFLYELQNQFNGNI